MDNFSSLLFYIAVIALSTFLIYLSERVRRDKFLSKTLVAIGLLIPILVVGLRYRVGTDYGTHAHVYEVVSQYNLSDFSSNEILGLEYLTFAFVHLSKILFDGPLGFFLILGVITMPLYYVGIKRYLEQGSIFSFTLGYFLSLCFIFLMSFNESRQMAASAILFFASTFLFKKRNISKFVVLALLASQLHLSAWIAAAGFLLTFIVFRRTTVLRIPNRIFLVLTMLLIVSLAIFVGIISPYIMSMPLFSKYARYVFDISFGVGPMFFVMLGLIGLISFMFLYGKQAPSGMDKVFFLFLAVTAVSLMFGDENGFGGGLTVRRMGNYFMIFGLLLLAQIPAKIHISYRRTAIAAIIVLFGFSNLVLVYYIQGQREIFPYRTVIQGHSI